VTCKRCGFEFTPGRSAYLPGVGGVCHDDPRCAEIVRLRLRLVEVIDDLARHELASMLNGVGRK